jgi:hypothetical protein
MSRMSHEEFVGYCVTLITHCRCVLDSGNPSPLLVYNLLKFLDPLDLKQAIATMRNSDTSLHPKLLGIQAYHSGGCGHEGDHVNWAGAERTWKEVKRELRLFAEQQGEQVLVPTEDAIPLLREAMRSLLPQASPSPASR